jgi:hypothetical protein
MVTYKATWDLTLVSYRSLHHLNHACRLSNTYPFRLRPSTCPVIFSSKTSGSKFRPVLSLNRQLTLFQTILLSCCRILAIMRRSSPEKVPSGVISYMRGSAAGVSGGALVDWVLEADFLDSASEPLLEGALLPVSGAPQVAVFSHPFVSALPSAFEAPRSFAVSLAPSLPHDVSGVSGVSAAPSPRTFHVVSFASPVVSHASLTLSVFVSPAFLVA